MARASKKRNVSRVRKNSAKRADAAYEKFHGAEPEETVTIKQTVHYHEHLTSLGELEGIKIRAVNGKDYTINFGNAYLAANEDLTQLFIEGGNQSLDVSRFGIETKGRESVIIGKIWCVGYITRKSFDDMEPALYVHTLGPEEDNVEARGDLWSNARPPKERVFSTDDLPILRYDARNRKVFIDGGTYSIDKPLIGVSGGIEN